MQATLHNRRWGRVLAMTAVAAVLAAGYVAAQSGAFFENGRLVPFADPTDNPDNRVTLYTHSMLAPGQVTPWHYHTGDIYLIVTAGTVTEDLGCGRTMDFPAGTVDHTPVGVVHRVINNGNNEVIAASFQIHPKGTGLSLLASEPTCQ